MEYTEEEKEAIELFKKWKNQNLENWRYCSEDRKILLNGDKLIEVQETILTLLDKLQMKITSLENTKHNCPLINTSGVTCEMKERGIVIGMDFSNVDYIPKEAVRKIIEKIKEMSKLAEKQLEGVRCIVADSDSLNFGRKQAHIKDIEMIEELLGE